MYIFKYDSKGPYEKGKTIITHKGRDIATLLHSKEYSEYIQYINDLPFKLVKVDVANAHRPDLIAHQYYQNSIYYWLVMEVNDITDPYEQLNAGDPLKIIDFGGYVD